DSPLSELKVKKIKILCRALTFTVFRDAAFAGFFAEGGLRAVVVGGDAHAVDFGAESFRRAQGALTAAGGVGRDAEVAAMLTVAALLAAAGRLAVAVMTGDAVALDRGASTGVQAGGELRAAIRFLAILIGRDGLRADVA